MWFGVAVLGLRIDGELSCDLAFDLEGPKREELLGVAQLIELAQLLADRVHGGVGQATAPA